MIIPTHAIDAIKRSQNSPIKKGELSGGHMSGVEMITSLVDDISRMPHQPIKYVREHVRGKATQNLNQIWMDTEMRVWDEQASDF